MGTAGDQSSFLRTKVAERNCQLSTQNCFAPSTVSAKFCCPACTSPAQPRLCLKTSLSSGLLDIRFLRLLSLATARTLLQMSLDNFQRFRFGQPQDDNDFARHSIEGGLIKLAL